MPAEALGARRLLFMANGHGEDAIAAQIVGALPAGVSAEAYPMLGAGQAFVDVCPIVGPRAVLASQGWRNVKGSLRRDIATGGLMIIPPALKFLRGIRGRYDHIVVVGDMMGVLACLVTGHRGLTYLDVYKTGAARAYSRLEAAAVERCCKTVFCRSEALAVALRQSGIDARCAGNVMMDTIPSGHYDANGRRHQPRAVTLLPGSRALTAESFKIQVDALRVLAPAERPDVFVAVASGINVEELARQTGLHRTPMLSAEPGDLGQLSDGDLTVHMARGEVMGNLLEASDVVMSQAGTATVQALGRGRPVITFINPRDRRSRFRDEQSLFGEARVVTPANATEVAKQLRLLLSDDAERLRLASIGRQRIGGPGAMAAIVGELAS